MIGLLVLVVGAIYLAGLVFATRAAYRWAAKKGLSKPKRILAGVVGFLVVYLPVFWDHIPTLVMHKYYCEKEAGFWVYKTLEQWKAENPGMLETLVAYEGYPSSQEGDIENHTNTNFLNPRFNLVVNRRGPLFLHRWLREDTLIDATLNETLARYVDFSTSQERRKAGWSGWKFWLDSKACPRGLDNAIESGNFVSLFKGK
ncbi:MAG: hypothetical protein ACREYF_10635 [Gammaproteobacteria bacterium]